MKKVICNASPLIALSSISQLELLEKIFKNIIIPEAVYKEVVEEGKGKTGAKKVEEYVGKWIELKNVKNLNEVNILRSILDYGEAEVIVLGQEIKADLLVLDNKEPRLFAKQLGFKVIGTIGILILAYEKGFLENPIKEILKIKEKGFYISDKLIKEIIEQLNQRGN